VAARSEGERARLVRRSTILLAAAQVALWGSIGVSAAFGPITTFELTHRESSAAVLLGVYFLGAAGAARVIGRAMDRAGRRLGLAIGYAVLAAGGVVVAVAAAAGSFAVLLGGAMLLGAGVGAGQLGRGAVADMYPPDRRGRAIGTLLVAGTAGAVGGPPLAGGIHSLARGLGWGQPLVAAWLLVPILAGVGLALVTMLSPDPRDLAAEGPSGAPARRPGEILRLRPGLVAVCTIATAQVVMVTFMGVVPVVLHAHGAGAVTVSLVVSFHLAGMFAFSRFVGSALDRWGRRTGLIGGAALLAGGVLLSLVAGTLIPAAGLFLVGVGWSAAYLGSTAVVSDLATPVERGGALGLTDLVASLAAAIGVLSGAAVLEAAGLPTLVMAALVLVTAAASLIAVLREPARPMAATSEG
jgi:MFS family permease